MVDLLDEVRDDLREERAFALIKKYGKMLAWLMVVIVLGTSLKLWWDSYKANQTYKEGSEFMMALKKAQADKLEQAIKELENIAENGKSSYAVLAKLHLAAYYFQNNNLEKASGLYTSIASSNAARELKDYAELMRIKIALGSEKPDLATVIDNLNSYLRYEPIFKYTAAELLSIAELQAGNSTQAIAALQSIENGQDAPLSIRERAIQLSKTIISN